MNYKLCSQAMVFPSVSLKMLINEHLINQLIVDILARLLSPEKDQP